MNTVFFDASDLGIVLDTYVYMYQDEVSLSMKNTSLDGIGEFSAVVTIVETTDDAKDTISSTMSYRECILVHTKRSNSCVFQNFSLLAIEKNARSYSIYALTSDTLVHCP